MSIGETTANLIGYLGKATKFGREIWAPGESNGAIPVNVQCLHTDSVDLYLHLDEAQPSITATASLDDTTLTVNSVAGVSAGDAITVYEGDRFFQSLVVSAVGTTITLASPLDYGFGPTAQLRVGAWNFNVDGSTTPVKAAIWAPPAAQFDLHSVQVTMTSTTVMDSAKFGGIAALTNGVLFRIVDGVTKNLPLIVNNTGFHEIGFSLVYDEKAPAGVYGLRASKNYCEVNGRSVKLGCCSSDELQFWIRDDLTGLDLLSVAVNGHILSE